MAPLLCDNMFSLASTQHRKANNNGIQKKW